MRYNIALYVKGGALLFYKITGHQMTGGYFHQGRTLAAALVEGVFTAALEAALVFGRNG